MNKREGIDYKDAAELARNVSKSDIDDWAATLIAPWCKFRPGDDVSAVVGRLGGRIHYNETLDSPEGGTILVHKPRDFDIVLSPWTSVRRDQFTLAHELGHYCLHSEFGKQPIWAARSGSGRSEWEANWFAAGFLMPEAVVREMVAKGTHPSSMAARLGVSRTAVDIRLQSLGLELL